MYKIVGIEVLDYTNKKGQHVKGYVLHYVDALPQDKMEGYRANNAYFSGETDLKLGDCVDIYYNQYRKPSMVTKVE